MKEETGNLENEKNMITARFTLSYRNPEMATAVLSSLRVDNEEFNKTTGKQLVEGRLENNRISLVVKGRSISSFRATVDDLLRALLAVEKVVEELEKQV